MERLNKYLHLKERNMNSTLVKTQGYDDDEDQDEEKWKSVYEITLEEMHKIGFRGFFKDAPENKFHRYHYP